MKDKKVIIIGAGMAGCLMAINLARGGFEVEIYESRDDILKRSALSERSVNLSLAVKGIEALKAAGMWEKVKKISLPQKGRLVYHKSGEKLYHPYGRNADFIEWTVNRNELNKVLLDEARKNQSIKIYFNQKLVDIDLRKRKILLENRKNAERVWKDASVIIGADGINSAVRGVLYRERVADESIKEFSWGYKNIYIDTSRKDLALPKTTTAFHLWPRKHTAIFGMVNVGQFTCTITLPLKGDNSFESINSQPVLLDFFRDNFPEIYPFIPDVAEDFINSRPTVFRTVSTSKWSYKDFIVLIGDSAHAMPIFYGQGVNSAFDDCRVLSECISSDSTDLEKAFSNFQKKRKVDTDVMAKLCEVRFIELKDKYESPFYLAQKEIEIKLESWFPNKWMGLYNLVVHTDLPYSKALRRYEIQRLVARFFGLDVCEFVYGVYLFGKQRLGKKAN